MTQLRCTSATGKALKPIRASAALEAAYYRDLMRLVREMDDSITYWLKANYRKHEAVIAQDSVADELQKVMNKLTARWRGLFDDRARKMAEMQSKRWQKHSDVSLMDRLKQAGFAVKFRPSKAVTDTLDGLINENVGLIKSIAEHHLTEVSGMVQRSVMAGRDLETLTKDLKERYGITQRRAAFIARDQNNKATSFITRTRQIDLGLTEAIWCHSSAGKHPRPKHVEAGRKRLRYDIRKGADVDGDGRLIFPGEEPNCFTGDTLVNLDNGCHKIWRHNYRGDVLILEFGDSTVRATPNHPLLTNKGWVAAESIKCGDYVWEARRKVVQTSVYDCNVTEARFDDLFDAFRVFGNSQTDAGSGFNFHGHIPNSKVETVWTNDGLSQEGNAKFRKGVREFLFSRSNGRGAGVNQGMKSVHSLAPCGGGEVGKITRAQAGEPLKVGFPPIARLQSKGGHPIENESSGPAQVTGHQEDGNTIGVPTDDLVVVSAKRCLSLGNPSLDKDALNNAVAGSDACADIGDAQAVVVEFGDDRTVNVDLSMGLAALAEISGKPRFAEMLAEFIRINASVLGEGFECGEFSYVRRRVGNEFRREYFSGHVYTLESNSGYYTVGKSSTATKNCRCTSQVIIPGFDT